MATIGKSIKTALRVFDTEDGYRFFELPDGTLVDNLDPDAVDMAFDNIEQLKDEMGDGVIQVGDKLSEFRYKKNNADPFELQRQLAKLMSKGIPSAAGAGVLGASALAPQEAEAKIISSLQALREGEIKAPKNDKTAQLAAAIRAGERAVKGSPAEFVYPSGLAPWLERIAYDEEPTKMETVMAIADFL
jgi:hypothetical protein